MMQGIGLVHLKKTSLKKMVDVSLVKLCMSDTFIIVLS